MLQEWLSCAERESAGYKFAVVDSTELLRPNDHLLNYLAHKLVVAHQNPEMLKAEYQLLVEDTDDLDLSILKQWVHFI
jgi:hypothetical protein